LFVSPGLFVSRATRYSQEGRRKEGVLDFKKKKRKPLFGDASSKIAFNRSPKQLLALLVAALLNMHVANIQK